MNLFDEIQNDILGNTPLSTILRKAKVLAYRLKNQEFKDWVEHEIGGYRGEKDEFPEYRKISTESHGDFINSAWKANDVNIPMANLPPEFEALNEVEMHEGVKELESLIETLNNSKEDKLRLNWPASLIPYLNNRVCANMNCMGAWRIITRGQITQILDSTRNGLLSFILELAERHPEEAKVGFEAGKQIPDEKIRQIFNYYIMGGAHKIVSSGDVSSQGGNMTVFDQRGQKVNYQYNAAGNINFDSVQNRMELIRELEKFKAELSEAGAAGAIDGEIVTDAEYQITKAIQQSQKLEPNKQTILDHIKTATTLIGGISTAAGMVTSLVKAAELVRALF